MSKAMPKSAVAPSSSSAGGYVEEPPTINQELSEVEVASNSSDGESSDTEENEGSDNDQTSEHSGDGHHDPSGGAGGSADGSSGAMTMPTATVEETEDMVFTDPEFVELVAKAETEEQIMQLIQMAKVRAMFYYKIAVERKKVLDKMAAKRRKQEREEKKRREKEEAKKDQPTTLTITVMFCEVPYSIVIPCNATLKVIRDVLSITYPDKFGVKRHVKNLRFLFKNEEMGDHARRTAMTMSDKKTGWAMENGSVVYASVRGQGGGKRGRAGTNRCGEVQEQVSGTSDVVKSHHPPWSARHEFQQDLHQSGEQFGDGTVPAQCLQSDICG